MHTPKINWYLIANAMSYYKVLGYKHIEVPWHVSKEANEITAPSDKPLLVTVETNKSWSIRENNSNVQLYSKGIEYGYPIGSAEQGFLQLMLDGKLEKGKYVTCSPCFRNQEPNDDFHFNQFMKVELFVYNDDPVDEFHKMISHAEDLFTHYVNCEMVIMTEDDKGFATAIDIVTVPSNLELGSYGIGSYKDYKWVYGTGLAEPRLSQAKNL